MSSPDTPRVRHLVPYLLLALLCGALLPDLFPVADPDGGLAPSVSSDDVSAVSATILDEASIDRTGMSPHVELRANHAAVRLLHRTYGIRRGNAHLRAGWPGYLWHVRWSGRSPIDVIFGEEGEATDAEKLASVLRGEVTMEFDMQGRLLSYRRSIPDSIPLPTVTPEEARAAGERFLSARMDVLGPLTGIPVGRLLADSISAVRRIELPARTDFVAEWLLRDTLGQVPVRVSYRTSGDAVAEARIAMEVPKELEDRDTRNIQSLISGVLYIVTVIFLTIISFKRFRSYEIGFRMAAIIGVITGVMLGVKIYTIMAPAAGWEIIFPLLFGPLFYGGALVLVWAAAETVVRETWKDKIVTLDLLTNGHILHSRVGTSLVVGIGSGAVAYTLPLLTVALSGSAAHLSVAFGDNELYQYLSATSPLAAAFMDAFYPQTYVVAFFLMFLVSRVFRRSGSVVITLLTGTLLLASLDALTLRPVWAGIAWALAGAVIVVTVFVRTDVLAALTTLVVAHLLPTASVMAFSGHPSYVVSGGTIAAVLSALMVFGFVLQHRRGELTDLDAIMPGFARHISERERMRHELDIARTVQMSFLPKRNPAIPSLDIASRCSPALEVGGDYYDFVELEDGRLGVAVGDVSGKGTQAAFFMTLTKGFLRALARVSGSPARVLTDVNRLFFEAVERGVFISLIYGIFDVRTHRLTIARAGHNPVILRKSGGRDTQVVTPMGLALGLDGGTVFDASMKEVTVPYETGDVFVFYTDGLSEAMNRSREEFGEQRLARSIEHHAANDAAGILEGILADMRSFVGKTQQHDDVTAVVVKII